MTRCLTDAELQAFADHEMPGDDEVHVHVMTCESCQRRAEEARQTLRALRHAVDDRLEMPADLADRVERADRAAAASRATQAKDVTPTVRGATTTVSRPAGTHGGWMRGGWAAGPWGPRAWLSGAAAAVLLVAAIVVILSSVSRDSTLSASSVLRRSLQTLSETNGVELLEYDIQVDGTPMESIVSELASGRVHVQQVIDHAQPGRYRMIARDSQGTVLNALAQDPARRLRTGRLRTNEGTFFFRLTTPPDRPEPHVSPLRVQQAYLRAVVSVMQATADSKLTTREDESGTTYVVQVPPIAVEAGESMWELTDARAVIRGSDFLLTELTAHGNLFGQPFGIAFKLVQRDVKPADQVNGAMFEIASSPDDLVLEGEASDDPLSDIMRAALKELSRTRRANAR